jgi:hypothetical protein
MKKIMIFAAALLSAQVAFAGYYKGTHLKKLADAYDRMEQGYPRDTDTEYLMGLYGYVMGVVDSNRNSVLCVPLGVSVKQASAVVVKYLNNNPELWEKNANELVINALAPVFRCEKKE